MAISTIVDKVYLPFFVRSVVMSDSVPPLPSIADLKREALELNLTGNDITEYVFSQQAIYRNERAAARDLEKIKIEERDRIRDHELRMAQANASISANDDENRRDSQIGIQTVLANNTKLPMLKDGDDISAFFVRFERICQLLKVPTSAYPVTLGALLSGRAVEIYASLSADVTADYGKLRSALLTAFNKTPDGYRHEFRAARIKQDETYAQFFENLSRKFEYWVDSLSISHTYEALKEFILVDQLLSTINPELRLYVKERSPASSEELIHLCDTWASARKRYQPTNKSYPKAPNKAPTLNDQHESQPLSKAGAALDENPHKDITCHYCKKKGHFKSSCPSKPRTSSFSNVNFCWDKTDSGQWAHMTEGTVNGCHVSTILLDTGCDCIIVSDKILPDLDPSKCNKRVIHDYLGRKDEFPVTKCRIKCKYFDGWAQAVVAPLKFAAVLLGGIDPTNLDSVGNISCSKASENIPEARLIATDVVQPVHETLSEARSGPADMVNLVSTRSGASAPKKDRKPIVSNITLPSDMTRSDIASLQSTCPTLEHVRSSVGNKTVFKCKGDYEYNFVKENELIFKVCTKSNMPQFIGLKTLVLPKPCRSKVMSVAHESVLAGHFSFKKTKAKIFSYFFWPGATTDIRNFCRSCDKCQRLNLRKQAPVPLVPTPIISEPFKRVNIDIVGPINPPSSSRHKYLLTLIDLATNFPEAIPLKDIDSVSVSEALLEIFSRVGIPGEILSDNGIQFRSNLLKQINTLLGVKPIFTTVYHPETSGRIERMHSTMKSCLRKLCEDKPRSWNSYVPCIMFALREMPNDTTGFSPFELLYGRQARGPLAVLSEMWLGSPSAEDRNLYQYVIDLQDKLKESAKLVEKFSSKYKDNYKKYFDRKALKSKSIKAGDEVLLFLPDSRKKLLMAWKGPYKVIAKKNQVNYEIDQDGQNKLYHVNLLKKYHRRACENSANVIDSNVHSKTRGTISVVQNCVVDAESEEPVPEDEFNVFQIPDALQTESTPIINPSPSSSERIEIEQICKEDVFSTIPGLTKTLEHEIILESATPVRGKCYPVPVHLQKYQREEVDKLLNLGIIQPSTSPYCFPVVMVRKSNNQYRMAIDYRELNKITVSDAEPACNVEDDLHKFTGCRYFTEIDCTKAYYQISMENNSMRYTAFPTHRGLMEFTRMPFGVKNACATYTRLMRIVLADLEDVSFYFDNIIIFSKTFPDHLLSIRKVLNRLKQHGLTAQPAKCKFAFQSIDYLGFAVSGSDILTQKAKIEALQNTDPPQTKKQLRSFLGCASFYRKFVPHLAEYTASLTDLLKKDVKNPLQYSDKEYADFEEIKNQLSSHPILHLPDISKPFVLRTDSSGVALGAVLLQYTDDVPYPVAYVSRKLKDAEKRYSTIERECLAMIFGVTKFRFYLIGKKFILEVDHQPLAYLTQFKGDNSRIMRWALCLQNYDYQIAYIKGCDNHGADFLSRPNV